MTEQTTALTVAQLPVAQRAIVALRFDEKKELELRELAARTTDITSITNADGRAQVHAARMVLKNQRLQLKGDAEADREDANDYCKAVIALQKKAIAIIEPEEDRLQKLQDAWDEAIEAEKQAKIAAEQKRVADLQARVVYLRGNQILTPASGSALIADHISDLEAEQVDASFEEYQQQAEETKATGLERLRALHAAAVAHEAEQARLNAEREELEQLRAAQIKRDAEERARIAEEERQAKAARDAEAAKQAAELKEAREKQQAEAAAERKRIADEEAAAKAIRDAEAAKQAEELRAQRAAQAKADAEAQAIRDAEAKKLADERAVFEKQQAEARRAKEEEDRAERERSRLASIKKPADDELLGVLASHYSVPTAKVVEWLLAVDFTMLEAAA